MTPKLSRMAWAVFLVNLMLWYPVLGQAATNRSLGKVIPSGSARLNGEKLALETTLHAGDTVATLPGGMVLVLFPKGDQLHLGPASQIQVSETPGAVLATLERGALLARSGQGQTVAVHARGLLVRPQGAARYEVALAENAVLVAAEQGAVTVQGTGAAFTVPAGQLMRFEPAAAPQRPVGAGVDNLAPTTAAWVGAIAAGGAFVLAWLLAQNLAEDACRDAIRSISPSASTARC